MRARHDGRTLPERRLRASASWLLTRPAMAELPPSANRSTYQRRSEPCGPIGSTDLPTRTPMVLLHGRNASTPMWRANLPVADGAPHRRTASTCSVSRGCRCRRRADRRRRRRGAWLDEALTGLGLDRVHLLGVSIGGWTAISHAVHRPGRAASLTLLDPAMTFARLPVKTVLATLPLVVPWAPEALRRRVLSWIAGGADVDDTLPEAALISAGSTDFVLRQAAADAVHRRAAACSGCSRAWR